MVIRWRDSLWPVSLVAVSVCVDLVWHQWVGFVRDDAYITFRYSQNITNGLGFVYNAGEHVYGTSSPGLALILAGWLTVFQDPLVGAVALNVLASALSLIFIWGLLGHLSMPISQRMLVGLILIWSDKLLIDMMAGMETGLVIACMMASLYFMVKGKSIPAGIVAGIMLWMRLDSALWVVAIAAVFLWARSRDTLIFAVVTSLAYLPWVVFAQSYFGNFIPTTAIAKQVAYAPNAQPWMTRLEFLSGWLAPFTILDHPSLERILALVTDGVALAAIFLYRKVTGVRVLAVFFVLQTTMLIAMNMTVEQRYFTTSLYVLLLLFGIGLAVAWSGIRSRWLQGGIAAIYVVSAFWFAQPRMAHLRDYQQYVYEASLMEMGKWLKNNSPSDAVVYLEPLGYVGYYAERKMLDDVGFATPATIPFKKANVDSYSIAMSLQADYMVLHCDDAQNVPQDFTFMEVVRFDPLGFKRGEAWADKALQRTACYQINKNEKSH